jgi:plasmid stabilization system protein ParE
MKISVSKSAFNDLENIISYYNSQGVPDIGIKFAKAIIKHIEVLSEHPDIGRVVPEFELEHIREIIHNPFRVIYQRDTNSIKVIRVWRSERLLVLPTET